MPWLFLGPLTIWSCFKMQSFLKRQKEVHFYFTFTYNRGILMAFQLCAKPCFVYLLELAHQNSMRKWEEELALPTIFFRITNAFITATLKSHGKLRLTSFSLLFEKTQIILWNGKILKTKRNEETAIFSVHWVPQNYFSIFPSTLKK